MLPSFSQYLVEEERIAYFTFGRMNPPTAGHGMLLDKLAAKAGKNTYRVYLSQSHDSKKNPLLYTDKVKFARKMFPKHARNIMLNKDIKTVFDVATKLYDEGFKSIAMVVGSDRINEFDILLKKYNGQKGRHGFYNFEKIMILSAGERDPDSEGITGMSASKMRGFAQDNDFITFSQNLPRNVSNSEAKKLFNAIRNGMGLKEETKFKQHVELKKVSDIREAYIAGDVFNIGDKVNIIKLQTEATIRIKGSNYVIVETDDGKTHRMWLDSIEPITEKSGAGEWGTKELANRYKKDTPGQSENVSNLNQRFSSDKEKQKKEHDKEKQAMKIKHDRMKDAQRRATMLRKNRGISEMIVGKNKIQRQDIKHKQKLALDALHKLVQSKGSKHSIGSYAFDIARSYNVGLSGKELEKIYRRLYGAE